jgi:hypothetical protein
MKDPDQVDKIVKLLTRELLSHDYYISRREAQSLGLPVIDATYAEANLLWQLYEDVAGELKLSEPWNWEKELKGQQSITCTSARGILESKGLKHVFMTTYQLKRVTQGPGGGSSKVEKLNITILEQSWKKV